MITLYDGATVPSPCRAHIPLAEKIITESERSLDVRTFP